MVWYGLVRFGTVCYGLLWFAMVCYGLIWFAMVCFGLLWLKKAENQIRPGVVVEVWLVGLRLDSYTYTFAFSTNCTGEAVQTNKQTKQA